VTDASAGHGYPRPQLRRDQWRNLNGVWDFAFDPDARWHLPAQVAWERQIAVPFAPETPASGIGDTGFHPVCWYRRAVETPALGPGERLLLHFGAVDYAATVWVNDRLAGRHEGGYTPFAFDITDGLAPGYALTIVVRAEDDPHDLAKPRGKQDWLLHPHSIWYPRTSGIWQTVWLEPVPATRLAALRWTPSVARWEIGLEAAVAGEPRDDLRLRVRLRAGDRLLADDTYSVLDGEVRRAIALADPGIDDARRALLWSPESPTLIAARLELRAAGGQVLDAVESYTALREVRVAADAFLLNGRPLHLRLVLDQGYWPESGLTPPDDAAPRRDVELARAMGFNGVRKHQKLADPRELFWADTLGLLVWEEMPSAYRFTPAAVERLTREWVAAVARDASHPCIVAWVPFNESWGVPELPNDPAQRDYVRAIYRLTKTLDPTRPAIGNDGWEHVAGDVWTIHDYDDDPARLLARYGGPDARQRLLAEGRLGGRRAALDPDAVAGRPVMLTEFGGIAFTPPERRAETWGYTRSDSAEAFADHYAALVAAVRACPLFAGFCYTQFADTYQEANGLLFADRTPKFPLDEIARATRGDPSRREAELAHRRELAKGAATAGDGDGAG